MWRPTKSATPSPPPSQQHQYQYQNWISERFLSRPLTVALLIEMEQALAEARWLHVNQRFEALSGPSSKRIDAAASLRTIEELDGCVSYATATLSSSSSSSRGGPAVSSGGMQQQPHDGGSSVCVCARCRGAAAAKHK